MAINIVDVEDILRQRTSPLTLINLQALNPEREPYRTILLQPEGVVEANNLRVGHADSSLGDSLCSGFLSAAVESHSDLAVAPEYCTPWSVVEKIAEGEGEYRPPYGSLWVLGCESISPADLQAYAQKYNAAGNCAFHHEALDSRQVAQRRYVDPLLYVFWTKNQDEQPVLFFLVQLKTVACRDYRDIEQTSLYLGNDVYAFNRGHNKMSLISIICSDAFNFTEHILNVHTNCLLIHIQLNPKPAHPDYAAYRTQLCSVGSNSNVELLCLNWAKNIREIIDTNNYSAWENVAGSAWYAPPNKFSANDNSIDSLHEKGLYYSLLARRWHSFFLNYEGQIIQLQKQKLLFLGEQALAPKNFITVEERWSWDSDSSSWQPNSPANDGFADALTSYHHLADLALQTSPLAVERAIELLIGPSGAPSSWYTIKELDSIHLDDNEESIRRVTVHQDPNLSRPGSSYRLNRLQRAHDAIGLANNNVPWPPPCS